MRNVDDIHGTQWADSLQHMVRRYFVYRVSHVAKLSRHRKTPPARSECKPMPVETTLRKANRQEQYRPLPLKGRHTKESRAFFLLVYRSAMTFKRSDVSGDA